LLKKIHTLRLEPKQELLSEISRYCYEKGVSSAIVIGIIGSVERATLNFIVELPRKFESAEYSGPLEIVCGQGLVALKNDETIIHIHIQLAGQDMCRGGHLVEAIIFSTAEVVIGELDYQLYR
jgi:predicted DNA-binding protein with PD1-like motif